MTQSLTVKLVSSPFWNYPPKNQIAPLRGEDSTSENTVLGDSVTQI